MPRICATPGPWHRTGARFLDARHHAIAAGLLPRRQAPGRCVVAGATSAVPPRRYALPVAPSEPHAYVSAFVPPSLRERLEEAAREHDRSLSGELRVALRAYLAEPEQRERITRSGGVVVEEAGR